MSRLWFPLLGWLALLLGPRAALAEEAALFSRHVEAVFSRLGCNGGTCHGAVRGQGGFRLSLFSADPAQDHERLVREFHGRRLDRLTPEASLVLLKATGQVAHGGGKRLDVGSPNYEVLRSWIAAGARLDAPEDSRVARLTVTPAEQTVKPGETYRLRVEAAFANGATEDVTGLCSFDSQDRNVATVDPAGQVRGQGVGDTALLVRFRTQPAVALVLVPRPSAEALPEVAAGNFIDRHILAKLRRLNVPPAAVADDGTFLRRASLDVTGELPTPAEVRAFLADKDPNKRTKRIDELLARPGYAALWTLKFCDLLKASDFGVYADGIAEPNDAPRFQQWVRARLEENLPYDQFAERILTATSREGRSLEDWGQEVIALEEGFKTPRTDLETYSKRKTLDLYWQRRGATGVSGALQVAHGFLGLRLECAQCHRHPHDVWQQDDLLSFANFFMRVRRIGFQGDNEKKFTEVAAHVKGLNEEAKKLADKAKEMKAGGKKLEGNELKTVTDLERRSKMLPEIGKRLLHAEIHHVADGKDGFASVTSPLGTQASKQFRLLGESKAIEVPQNEDPRQALAAWLRRPDNPFFARAIVNRVWAHYFSRGIVDPPDHLSPFNPPSHPELLKELSEQFVKNGYDLKWLHRAILTSRTYQQSSQADPASAVDRANYAYFYYRRLPAEVLVDALNRATGTVEDMDMKYYHWLPDLKTVEIPYTPRNGFVVFMMEQFGKPARNSSSQCDCERDPGASVLQVLSVANHPRVWQKIADPKGQAARIIKDIAAEDGRIEEVFLVSLSRLPTEPERQACRKYLQESESPEKGVQGIMWCLLNTREFLLQH